MMRAVAVPAAQYRSGHYLARGHRGENRDDNIDDGVPLPRWPRTCALFLLLWEDWRAENGSGIAYSATPPTAGDVGKPIRGSWADPRRGDDMDANTDEGDPGEDRPVQRNPESPPLAARP
jgi:hypothetical protein